MRVPTLTRTSTKQKPQIIAYSGLNRQSIISDTEISDGLNLSFKDYPCVSNRPPRTTVYTLTAPHSMGLVGDKIGFVDGTNYKVDNVTKGTVAASDKCFVDLNDKILILPDWKTWDYVTNTFATVTTGTFPTPGAKPLITIACVHNNRIFGCKNNSIYACKRGDMTDWTTVSDALGRPFSTSAYWIDWDSEGGYFTAITSYSNHVVVWKNAYMYELYNVNPPYQIQRVNKVGCLNNKAFAEVNSVLYFASNQGIHAYTGGVPRLISQRLNAVYTNATLGTDGKMLYCSLYDGTAWELLVYDTERDRWMPEDDIHITDFIRIGTSCYALDSTGAIRRFNYGTEAGIVWNLETKDFTSDVFNKKSVNKIRNRFDLEDGSSATVYIAIDGQPYKEIGSYTGSGLTTHECLTRIRRCDRFKLKFEVKGNAVIYATQFEYYVGEDG